MKLSKKSIIRKGATLALMSAIVFGTAVPAFAADSVVSLGVTSGTQTASVATLTLDSVAYDHEDQAQTGTMALIADDSTGSNAGWNVTLQTSPFVFSAGTGGTDIPAANFGILTANTPVMTAGQALDTGGPLVPATISVGPLDDARTVLQADPTFGNGTYTQGLDVELNVPAQSAAGTYTGTLTTTIDSGAP
jgi:hypothetical protein